METEGIIKTSPLTLFNNFLLFILLKKTKESTDN